MKFTSLLYLAASACISINSVLSKPCRGDFAFQIQSADSGLFLTNLPSHLSSRATFYRAVTGRERPVVSKKYPVGGHPMTPFPIHGDFSPNGAVYVFADINQAIKWGDGWSKGHPDGNTWYLVTFQYTPIPGTRIRSFLSGTDEWKKVGLLTDRDSHLLTPLTAIRFVAANYENGGASVYDAVEGPVSVGKIATLTPYLEDGSAMVYQAGFMNDGLNNLVAASVVTRTAGGGPEWCNKCNIS
ncbi:hypothetical protein BJ165DRAFT_1595279 [Panaeolus papilionaceus]|nr:hypothetical protein BJ165DRAFT_1595279 [Panaeolus papilionaceus]